MKKSLAPPIVRDGAETEVEGDASTRPRMRIRTAGHVLHPHSPLPEGVDSADLDEIMLDALDGDSDEGDADAGSGSGSADGMGIGVDIGMGNVMDNEGVVSGKRKR